MSYFVASCHILVKVITRFWQTLVTDVLEAEIVLASVAGPKVALNGLLTMMLVWVQAK